MGMKDNAKTLMTSPKLPYSGIINGVRTPIKDIITPALGSVKWYERAMATIGGKQTTKTKVAMRLKRSSS